MIAAGVASKLVFSWLGNPGVGGLGAIRRRIEGEIPDEPLAVEEYSHFGMVGRYTAGAMNLPFFPLRSYFETDLPVANPLIRPIESPYGDGTVYAVPPLRPDVTIVHAQRASAAGDTQVWGLAGCQKEAAFAADRVIVVVEEVVDEAVIRADPEPDHHPRPDRGCRRRRAVGRASRRMPRATTIATTGSTSTGIRSAATRPPPRRGCASGSTTSMAAPPIWTSSVRERKAALRPGHAPSGSVDYGEYR